MTDQVNYAMSTNGDTLYKLTRFKTGANVTGSITVTTALDSNVLPLPKTEDYREILEAFGTSENKALSEPEYQVELKRLKSRNKIVKR